MTCKNHIFSDNGIMIAPEPDNKADPNFRLPKQTASMFWVDIDILKGNSHSLKNTIKILANCTNLQPLTLLVWVPLLTVNKYPVFQVNIFSPVKTKILENVKVFA